MSNINDFGMPFTSQAGDRAYSSLDWRWYFALLHEDGIISGYKNELRVNPQVLPNKSIYVDSGSVLIQGAIRSIDSTINLQLADNASGNPRIDRIVARINSADRKIEFIVKQGTPATSPVPSELIRNESFWELPLASIYLANGYTTITETEIIDERLDEEICGYAKTMYMQQFDDENNLLKYKREVSNVDSYGYPIEVLYTRPLASTLFMKRSMSNPDVNGYYCTVIEEFYAIDGVSRYKTATYTLTYLPNGLIDTCEREVN